MVSEQQQQQMLGYSLLGTFCGVFFSPFWIMYFKY